MDNEDPPRMLIQEPWLWVVVIIYLLVAYGGYWLLVGD